MCACSPLSSMESGRAAGLITYPLIPLQPPCSNVRGHLRREHHPVITFTSAAIRCFVI